MTTKTRPKPQPATRQHEHEFEIGASPDAVWKAITEAEELVNWFPLEAEVEPGPDGCITYRWESLEAPCRIEEWEPSRHLRTSWIEGKENAGSQAATPLLVDWHLEGDKGRTRLRLVHSGFGPGKDWDDDYAGTQRGWNFELRVLKHYLEHHPGQRRTAHLIRKAVSLDAAQTWKRLFGLQGLVRNLDPASPRPGDKLKLNLSSGDGIEGKTFVYLPPSDFGFSAANLNQAVFRIAFESCFGSPEAQIWVSLWDYPGQEAEALKKRLSQALEELF